MTAPTHGRTRPLAALTLALTLVATVVGLTSGPAATAGATASASTTTIVVGGYPVYGAIEQCYLGLGGAGGLLGAPTMAETSTPDMVGRFQHFVGGSIYWTPATGAHEVHGAIRARWAALGWERSALGYPTSNEFAVTGGRRSNFVSGSIRWDAGTGALTVRTTPAPATWYGVLQPRAETAAALRPAGVRRATLEIGWNNYEPGQGTYDAGYLDSVRSRYWALRSAGLDVVLDAGLQYPPSWVFGVGGGTRFVNQYGDTWQSGIGADVPDAVFNGHVRDAQAAYLSRLGADLRGLPLAAVRVGGLYYGELHYPTAGYAGHGNSYWAFSAAAQAASPTPGYRPGQGDAATAGRFLDWYLGSLSGYGRWLASTYRGAFGPGPRLQVLEPSWGIRPREVQQAVAGNLTGGSRGEQRGTVNEGLDWARQLPAFASLPGAEAYTTWLDAGDQGTDDGYESPVRYLSRVAGPLGLAVSGENTGGNSRDDMARCVQRVRELGLTGMMWMREPELTDGYHASLADYRTLIG